MNLDGITALVTGGASGLGSRVGPATDPRGAQRSDHGSSVIPREGRVRGAWRHDDFRPGRRDKLR